MQFDTSVDSSSCRVTLALLLRILRKRDTWGKETLRLWASSLMMKSTWGPRMILETFLLRYNNWWCFCFDDCFCFANWWCFCFGCDRWWVPTVHLVCLFKETHLLALLQDNCLNLVHYAFQHQLSGCVRNITAFWQHLPKPMKSAVLADTNISVKPK